MSESAKVATGNRLSDGTVVFLADAGIWSEDIDSARHPASIAALPIRTPFTDICILPDGKKGKGTSRPFPP